MTSIKSEITKDMEDSEIKDLQDYVDGLNEDELKELRNTINPDNMGFYGEEGEVE